MKLLIVDDHAVNLKLLRAQLEADDHSVLEATNGIEALRLLERERVDGIVSDILMPDMDGFQLCLEVRRSRELADLPFIFYTATYSSPQDRELAQRVGGHAYLLKPSPAVQIMAAIRAAAAKVRPGITMPVPAEPDVLKRYSAALVTKLEQKNRELEQALSDLLERDAGLRRAYAMARLGSIITGPDGVFEAWSESLPGMIGVELSSMPSTAHEWFERIHPDDHELVRQAAVDAGRTGVRADVEYRLRRGDGSWMVILQVMEPLGGSGESAKATRWFNTLQDFTEQRNHAKRLRESERRFSEMLGKLNMVAMMLDREARVTYCNDFLLNLTGWSREEVLGGDWFSKFLPPAQQGEIRGVFAELLADRPAAWHYENVILTRSGGQRLIRWNNTVLRSESGEAIGTASIGEDITERREQEVRISRLSRVKAMRGGISSAVVRLHDRKALLDEVCRIAVEEGGLRAAWVGVHDAAARRVRPVASAGHLDGFLDVIRLDTDTPEGETASATVTVLRTGMPLVVEDVRTTDRLRSRDAALARGYLSTMHVPLFSGGSGWGAMMLYAGEPGFFDAEEAKLVEELAADVSFALESLQKSERLDYLAYYDALTGLPNRTLFQDRLSHSMHGRNGEAVMVAIVLLDLERFQRVNVTAGRDAGDDLLREVGARLQRANETAARVAVDLYALTLRGLRSAAEVNRAVESVIGACFREPFAIRDQELRIACRVAIALYPADGLDAEALLRNAETALHRAKRTGDRLLFYSPDMNARLTDALAIENRLRRAIERQDFVLHYQPKVRLSDGRVTGVEALIRWQDTDQGLVPPGRFIPILEETGLIGEVGRWAIERALADLNAWISQGIAVPRVAVNVSAIQLQARDFANTVIDAVARAGDYPERLELEITESLLMHEVDQSIRKLTVLRGMGIAMSIDDFGTGYSSLSYLARLPIDTVKIDRSFVMGITENLESAAIVEGIIALVHSLKLRVIAEGVETPAQAQRLASLGCDEAQGYYYSRPLPADGIAALLQAKGALPWAGHLDRTSGP